MNMLIKRLGGNVDHFTKYIALYGTLYVIIICFVVYMITQI